MGPEDLALAAVYICELSWLGRRDGREEAGLIDNGQGSLCNDYPLFKKVNFFWAQEIFIGRQQSVNIPPSVRLFHAVQGEIWP